MERTIYLITVLVLLSVSGAKSQSTAQTRTGLRPELQIAYDTLYKTTNGAEWTINNFETLKARDKAPYIRFGRLTSQGYKLEVVNLCNNNLAGKLTDKLWSYIDDSDKMRFMQDYISKWMFSHNKITSVSEFTGLAYTSYVDELHLDNNLIKKYNIFFRNTSIPSGFKVFTIHQNDIEGLKSSDFHNGGFKYTLYNPGLKLVRIDNNRLDFTSLCDVVPTIKTAYSYLAKYMPGSPDCVFDYYPQKPLGGDATTETVAEGTEKTLSFSLTHADNVYSWQLNGKDVPISTMKKYSFTVNSETAGVYRCKITNPNLPEITLYSYDMAVFMQKSGNGVASDITIQQSTLSDNFPESAMVADFSATDPDGDELFYRLPDRTADNSHFRIINGKTLVSSEVLFEKEYIESYTIEVEVYDRFGGTFRKEFTITKNGTSGTQLPSDIVLSNNMVVENSADKAVGTFSIEGGDGYSLSLVENESDNSLFKIDGYELKTAAELNFEKKRRLSVRVTATAADGTSIKKDFDVDVTDANDNPHDIVISSDRFNVNTSTGTIIGFISAIDEDETDRLFTYEADILLSDNKDFFFENNIIKAKTKFTEPCSKQITITVKDDEGALYTKMFDISVVKVDAGDNRPPRMIGLTSTVINTELETGGKIADIALSDPDGDKGTFSCDNDYVEINGNSLLLKSKPESEKVFDVTIKATDGENEIEQLFKIYVAQKDNGGASDIIMVGESMVKIYPNPAQSYIHIDGLESARYQILNSSGMVVKQTTNSNIDIDNLRQGCYILRIETGGEVITRKIIKKN